ncbi:cation-translocating P-type ATPase, partial [Streptomyces daliensis]
MTPVAEAADTGAADAEAPDAEAADVRETRGPRDVRVASCADAEHLTTLEILRALDAGPRGLSEDEAAERLRRYGENVLPGPHTASWARRFAGGLRDPFTAVLLALGLVSAAVASWGTACVITLLVAVSCALRSTGEHRAGRAMAGLRELVAATATVRRRAADGSHLARPARSVVRELPVGELVPGDVIQLGPGELVPADALVLRATGLTAHQSALSGESAPVPKRPADGPGDGLVDGAGDGTGAAGPLGLFAQPRFLFQGSSVTSGSATAVVIATGRHTRFAGAYREPARRGPSAFDRTVNGVCWTLIRFMLLTPPLVLMANAALRGRGLETLPFAVAVAVGLTPEMLPVVVTTALARGSALLARGSGIIVRRLPALHDLGAMDVLCVDKTGTLTQDRPVLDRSLDAEGRPDPLVAHWAALNSFWTLQLADLPTPDALDEALLEGVAALDPEEGGGELWEREGVAALPFDSVRRLSCAVVSGPDGDGDGATHTLVVKGAVEEVLARCDHVRDGHEPDADASATVAAATRVLDDAAREELRARAAALAASGLRLLAVAVAERPARPGPYTPADERGLTFLGFVALRDAVVSSAADALADLARRGVAVKVLTGDHPGTAARVCRELGLDPERPGAVVTADRIDGLSDAALASLAADATVFARCTPEHKARVVAALRAGGHTTGFLGDGVNDLPALHAADVGICPRGSADVTRETADVVLGGCR